jgi:tRNA A-37 threonylcarbamoyl transferase component Bud32
MSRATGWRLLPDVDPVAAECFADLDRVFTLEGEVVAADSMTRTLRVEINDRRYYVKRYAGLGKKPLRRWFATPRVQLEWENLGHFADWGIPTARLVGHGMESRGGRFLRGALITAEIPDTTDLAWLARNGDPRLKSRRWLDGVSRQLADIARRMHGRRFVHGDFKWRNLLVDKADTLHLIDCPSGGFWWPPFLEYRIVKDLACLDKLAKLHLSRTRRLRFYLDYAQKKTLDDGDKRRIRKIAGFFSGRDEVLATAASLRAAGRNPLPQSRIALDDGRLMTVESWQRILPGKRLTGSGEWKGRKVFAKLFIAARGSERHWQREYRGAATLARHGLPTPALLASGFLAGGGHYVLYEHLDDARNPDSGLLEELERVFALVGRMHARGLVQEDAHLGNFLLKNGWLYVIDGDAVR